VLNNFPQEELFKSTLPSPKSKSFLQLGASNKALRAQVHKMLETFKHAHPGDRARLNFIMLALRGKKIGFEKVIMMIDEMVANLKTEQVDDENKKEYCTVQFDETDDQKKVLERSIADAEAAMSAAKDGIATLTDEIAALEAGIKALDESVAQATEQRKSENEEFTELMASDTAAKKLLNFAKNRLNKFYNPKLYKPPPKRELSDEDRIYDNLGGSLTTTTPGGIAGTGIAVLAEVSAHQHRASGLVAPPPPPETFGAYTKKHEETGGVMSMIDLLIKDLDKEMTEAETEEKLAQEDYEEMMAASAEKRATDSKSITEKGESKAAMEGELQEATDAKASASKELAATLEVIAQLHAECDWLLKYFDARKEARTSEIEALGQAKAVLSGADYSLVQMKVQSRRVAAAGFLQRKSA
jgi:chromosome segregation ATPase